MANKANGADGGGGGGSGGDGDIDSGVENDYDSQQYTDSSSSDGSRGKGGRRTGESNDFEAKTDVDIDAVAAAAAVGSGGVGMDGILKGQSAYHGDEAPWSSAASNPNRPKTGRRLSFADETGGALSEINYSAKTHYSKNGGGSTLSPAAGCCTIM